MAISSTSTANGVTITRIDATDQLPLVAGQPVQTRTNNASACGCSRPGTPDPEVTVLVNAVAATNATRRFPTAALAAGVYQSGVNH